MGRSVSYPSNALIVTFNTMRHYYGAEEYDVELGAATEIGEEIENPNTWDDLVEGFVNACEECWPSLNLDIKWLDSEDQALLSNRLVRIGVSEYCGMIAYWVVPNEQNPECFTLAKGWAKQIEEIFVRNFGGYEKVGSMSNGEGVYQKISA
jgi:hypothetical protein